MSSVAGPSAAPSSDDDVQMLDSTGAPLPPASDSANAAEPIDVDAVGQGSDVPEDEYEIERIVSHSDDTIDGQVSYFVKWKGYPDSENSWVFHSDMGGAQEMIQEYWAKVPKKTVKKMGTKGKKGKRQSSVGVGSSSTPSKAAAVAGRKRTRRESSLPNGEAPKRGKKGGDLAHSRSPSPDDALIDIESDPALQRIRQDPSLSEDQRALLEQQHLHAIKIDRLRKRYARIPDWDPIVKKIEAVEKMSDNKLRVFVHFESGDRLAFESVVAHHRCPLKLLAFYEANLRFKRRDEEEEERVEQLRGEEELGELQEWNRKVAEEEAEAAKEGEKNAEKGLNGDGEGGEKEAEAEVAAEGVEESQTAPVEGEAAEGEPEVLDAEAEGEGEAESSVAVAVAVTETAEPQVDQPIAETAATTITTAIADGEEGVTAVETTTVDAAGADEGVDESQ